MLLFMDGQAHYDTAGLGLKYSALTNATCAWTLTAEGRFGNAIKRVANTHFAGNGYLDIAPLMTRAAGWTPATGGVCGFAMKVDALALSGVDENGPSTGGSIFALIDGSNFIWKIGLTPSGTFSAIQAWGPFDNYGAVMATSSEGLQNGAWAFVEFKWIIHPSAGLIEIRVNTVPVLSYTGDTVSHNPNWFATGTWNTVRLLHMNQNGVGPPWLTVRLCDLYLADLTAVDSEDVDDYLGDGTIETIMPNGVGSATGWTPTGVAANWDATNDRPAHDADGTYVTATTPGLQDTYNFEDIQPGSDVKGVHWNLLARKIEEGSVVVQPVFHQGADYLGPNQGVASTAYDRYLTQPYDINPATGAKWTAAEVNAGIWGVRKVL